MTNNVQFSGGKSKRTCKFNKFTQPQQYILKDIYIYTTTTKNATYDLPPESLKHSYFQTVRARMLKHSQYQYISNQIISSYCFIGLKEAGLQSCGLAKRLFLQSGGNSTGGVCYQRGYTLRLEQIEQVDQGQQMSDQEGAL